MREQPHQAPNNSAQFYSMYTGETEPVLPDWYEAYKHANLGNPQEGYGIIPYAGHAVVQSLLNQEIMPSYILSSQFTDTQVHDLRSAMIRAHKAYDIKHTLKRPRRMSENTDTAPHLEHISNDQLQRLWHVSVSLLVRRAVDFVDDPDLSPVIGEAFDSLIQQDPKHLSKLSNPELYALLDELPTTDTYLQRLPILGEVLFATTKALDSKKIQRLAKERRETIREGYAGGSMAEMVQARATADIQERAIMRKVYGMVGKTARRYDVPEKKITGLLDAPIGFIEHAKYRAADAVRNITGKSARHSWL